MKENNLLDSKPHEINGKVEILTEKMETLPIQSEVTNFKPKVKDRKFLRVGLVLVTLGIAFGGLKFIQERNISAKPNLETTLPNILSVQAIPIKLVNSYSVSQSYTGIVEAKRTSELGFEQSGLLTSIYIEEGEEVTKGTAIAQLDTSQTKAQKAVLIAQKDRAIATLKELENGARPEVIAATRASLAQEQAKLRELQTGPRPEVIAATRASLLQEQAKLQELQTGPRPEVIAATRASLLQEQAKLQELQTGPRTEDIKVARSGVLDLEEQLNLARLQEKRRQELYTEGAISQEQFDEASTQADTLQARLEQAKSELEKLETGTRREQVEAQQARVRQAQSQLDELIAGTRSEQIEAQRARVGQVQSQLDELIAGTRREQIEAQRARVGQVQSQLDELIAGTRREQIEAQQAEIRRFEAQISEIDVVLRKSTLFAPFSGIVSVRHLDEGVVVNAGQGVVRLVEGGERKVRVGVPPGKTSSLRVGSQQEVRVGERIYSARVLSILPEVDSMTRTQTVILALPQAIAPGTVVRLGLNQTHEMEGYWLPTYALVWGERGLLASYALVPPSQSDLNLPAGTYQTEKRMVEVLHTEGDRSLVRGVLQPGDLIVTNGTNQLAPGQLVKSEVRSQESEVR
ncbi:MAG: efflux RND transporter periplasmic adaptor subunit [Okeania sp. SIO2G4]|uniref:efflux RND transporter periplasmic adaptor subunit n=1 Tax=unclassified Okeania TaxID=2634635 RepID=UPI0013BAE633|nr:MULTISPECIES: efflux RND transporter periplasmic adaptor subunit [unclassified Okeania]NEP06512.1 efflux RND transporter periplasmic adaptor subunit [Okeania sp. SIO4D6]NEP39742.1 efflux RND transporter periplasmic adaptor subunit [Okeania sp. SIO2H7]NEP73734.1 efflux RND transporter periplasmic adaptor subunit [Okeania sp. SIO2G5]NEP95834.1 efflux RND transporter periplasmic adaptor subunit [Okeania sp. SIO2F5]NEQ92249.1 efflux RND transporter periplasmic adaptor subunit [Okeania sp. SIO2G